MEAWYPIQVTEPLQGAAIVWKLALTARLLPNNSETWCWIIQFPIILIYIQWLEKDTNNLCLDARRYLRHLMFYYHLNAVFTLIKG